MGRGAWAAGAKAKEGLMMMMMRRRLAGVFARGA